mgnify:FL=1
MATRQSSRLVRIIRETSPYFQGFLVRLMEDAYNARRKRNISNYRDALLIIFHSLPLDVRKDIIENIRNRLSALNIPVKIGALEEIIDQVNEYCRNVISRYDGLSLSKKFSICENKALLLYDIVYSCMMEAIHNHNIFVVAKTIRMGYYKPGVEE